MLVCSTKVHKQPNSSPKPTRISLFPTQSFDPTPSSLLRIIWWSFSLHGSRKHIMHACGIYRVLRVFQYPSFKVIGWLRVFKKSKVVRVVLVTPSLCFLWSTSSHFKGKTWALKTYKRMVLDIYVIKRFWYFLQGIKYGSVCLI